MASHRAQGAAEYLVLIAMVLTVALVSVSLLGFFPGTSSDVKTAASQAYWMSARPTGVYDAKTISSACNGSTGYTMIVENHEATPIRMTGISIDGHALTFCRPGGAPSSEILLDTYQKAIVEVPANISSNASGTLRSNVSINYITYYGSSQVQYGSTPLEISNNLQPLAPATCADTGQSCGSLACCGSGYCWNMDSTCHVCSGQVNGVCPSHKGCCCTSDGISPVTCSCQSICPT